MLNLKFSQHDINPKALSLCQVLSTHGHESFIVGGCLRDLLLGATPKDWDIATSATPQQVMKIFTKTIPTGLQHGTVTVVMGEGIENHFEVTTFRIEGEYKDGRRPEEVRFVTEIEQDLARRDLTINAIAYNPITNALVDPYGGMDDLQNEIIRTVGNPEDRFQEDGLRIMRAARFAARFGYTIESSTLEGMKTNLTTLNKVSKERIKDEVCKILMTQRPTYGMQILQQTGSLQIACPLLTSNEPYLTFIQDLDKCSGELETRLAFLYGNVLNLSALQQELIELKLSNKEIKKITFLLRLLDQYGEFLKEDSVSAYKGFIALIKNQALDPWEHTLKQFIQLTEAMEYPSKAQLAKYEQEIVFSRKEMQLNGDDLMTIGIKPGPQIKTILDACYVEILQNPEHNNKQFLLNLAIK